MAEELHVPLDFERLSEFRLLVNVLKSKSASLEPQLIETQAVFIWMRLFVELALLAKSTNRPGYLTSDGVQLFESTLDPLFGDDCPPSELLLEARLLERRDGELFCPRFAQLNPHFAGDFVKKEKVGNAKSIIARSERHFSHLANQQGMLLAAEIFRKRDGTPMTDTESQRAMMIIMRLDSCLKQPTRTKAQFSEGLLADAHEVACAHDAERLRNLYAWLLNHRDNAVVPKTAEGFLARFGEMLELANV